MAQMIQGREWTFMEILHLLQQIDEGYLPMPEEKQALREWKTLNLSRSQISALPESIGQLANLQTLDLYSTKITALPESIGQLANLRTLNLGYAQITALPESIGRLSKLQKFFFFSTPITTLPESFWQLAALQELSFGGTQITALPESIGQLADLRKLNLNSAKITALPESIGRLTKLQELSLYNAPITALPESIGQLACLQTLNLNGTQITALPESIGQLANLQDLIVSATKLSSIPESIGQLTKLQSFYLSGTRVKALPDVFERLTELRELGLNHTKIDAVPAFLERLDNLQTLYIGRTNIRSLPNWLCEKPSLKVLDLRGLTLQTIPEALARRGLPFVYREHNYQQGDGVNLYEVTLKKQDISVFLEHPELIPSLYKEKQITLRECRVIFLGDGASGKSYTIKRFRNEGKKETKKEPYTTSETPGVEILDYPAGSGAEAFTIHFWDFGGQQLLHSMHRCFLTDETCYVVTVKTRETKANERARYWLRNVQAFAPNSPILLFVNCWENDDGRRSIDEPGLCKEFPMIQNVVYCSAKQAEEKDFRENVMAPIIKMSAESDGLTRKVPSQWNSIRRSIERESEKANYLTKERYGALCAENGIEDKQAPELLSFFNTLGVCFSYHRDREKREQADYKLLRPVWLTNAIYAVIEEGRVHAPEGRISREQIEQMLCNQAPVKVCGKQYRRTAPELVYQPMECPFILDVAIAHDLCYPVDDTTLFFPALCGADTPAEALSDPEGYPQHVSYLLRYSYLPDSVLHQLMIRCMRNHLNVEKCWQRGMILYVWNLHEVVIRMTDDESLRIDVYSTGEQRAYDLFWALRKQIEEINYKLNLNAKEFILDETNAFTLGSVLAAARNNSNLFDEDGNPYNARKLLGSFYEESFAQTLQIEKGSIVIPIAKRTYHEQKKSDPAFRYALYEAYNHICPYCGQTIQYIQDMQVDHILATNYQDRPELQSYLRYLDGKEFKINKPDYIENYFPTHPHCNRSKSNRINQFTVPYWHDVAAQHTPKILELMDKYKKQSE